MPVKLYFSEVSSSSQDSQHHLKRINHPWSFENFCLLSETDDIIREPAVKLENFDVKHQHARRIPLGKKYTIWKTRRQKPTPSRWFN